MPSLLLDHHIDEAAMQRHAEPNRHRWGRRSRHHERVTVAEFVAAATSSTTPVLDRGSLGLGAPDHRPLRFDDLRGADPEWSLPAAAADRAQAYAAAENAYAGLAPDALDAEHAWRMTVAPLMDALAEPKPDTDWADKLHGLESHVCRALSQLAADTTDAIGDDWMARVAFLDDLQGDLAADVAGVRAVFAAEAELLVEVAV